MRQTFTLAHLSDVHLAPLVGFGLRHWGLKRLTGYINWHRNRRHVHLAEVVSRLVADVARMQPDHIAVTGDLVNIGLPQEHIDALAWLHSIGSPERVTVVPGNHDIYVRLRADPGIQRWRPYMSSNAEGAAAADQGERQQQSPELVSAPHPNPLPIEEWGEGTLRFPFVRRFGRIALVGVNSAVPTLPLLATGRVGHAQLERLAGVLERLGRERLLRIVLIHHPPLPMQASRTRWLTDAADLRKVLARHGAELVLHGHNHLNMQASCAWAAGHIPVIGVASASIGRPHGAEPLGRYNLYRIMIAENTHRIEVLGRGLAEPEGPVVELERQWLDSTAAVPG